MNVLDYVLKYSGENVYWKDKQGRYLGCNDAFARLAGFSSSEFLVGKSDRELFLASLGEDGIQKLEQADQQVMQEAAEKVFEEVGVDAQLKKAFYVSKKMPLKDNTGNIIGIFGISFNITPQKEAERLKLENELQKQKLETQEKISRIAVQVAHDLGSPLSSLRMLITACDDLPEENRVALREVVRGIEGIAQSLLDQYNPSKVARGETEEAKEVFLPAAVLQNLIEDRRMKHKGEPIEFVLDLTSSEYFECLNAQRSRFTRMISNLINNAVDAMAGQTDPPARLTLSMKTGDRTTQITVADTGKGMPPELVQKILNAVSVTHGKVEGHGIGLVQVRETLAANGGRLEIRSTEGVGTEMRLTFPYAMRPPWLGYELTLQSDSQVVILDDDASIHEAWKLRFAKYQKAHPDLRLCHFKEGKEAMAYLKALPSKDKVRTFLLTDYELLRQEVSGLDVIAGGGIARSLVVTSHYSSQAIQNRAMRLGSRVLPKLLAAEIPIVMTDSTPYEEPIQLVLLEDDPELGRLALLLQFGSVNARHYLTPEQFLMDLPHLNVTPETRFCLDNNFECSKMNGIQLASHLHTLGYTRLYLASGECFPEGTLPDYLKVIKKHRLEDVLA